jgi:hypothetical protein
VSDESEKRWVETTAGIITVNGIITAIVGSIVAWVIANATTLPWGQILWISVVVAVVVLIVISVVRKGPRQLLWGVRLTTKARMAKRETAAAAAIEQAQREGHASGYESGSDEVAERLLPAIRDLERQLRAATGGRYPDPDLLFEDPPTDAMILAAAKSMVRSLNTELPGPRHRPRWRLYRSGLPEMQKSGQQYTLKNLVENSAAFRVRVDSPSYAFNFLTGAAWDDLSGTSVGKFEGYFTGWAETHGVEFRVSWIDDEGTEYTETQSLPRTRNPEPWEADDAPF